MLIITFISMLMFMYRTSLYIVKFPLQNDILTSDRKGVDIDQTKSQKLIKKDTIGFNKNFQIEVRTIILQNQKTTVDVIINSCL